MDISFPLKQALENGSCVLFVGAGMGYHMFDQNGQNIPDAKKLAQNLAGKFDVPVSGDYDLAKISQYIEMKKKGRKELLAYIQECLAEATPDQYMMWIPSVKWKAIFTTNYDNSIQKAYNSHESPIQDYVTITRSTGIKHFNTNFEVPIFHLHGALFEASSPDIIITQQDYVKYKTQRKMMFEELKHYMAASNVIVLYVGYSHNDTNWNSILSDIEEEFYPDSLPLSYRVDPYTSEIDMELLKDRNLVTIPQKFDDFVIAASIQIQSIINKDVDIRQHESMIPGNLTTYYLENPVATLRLISSWEYVNQVNLPNVMPDVSNYVRGDKPTWSLVFHDKYFKRDIEEEIYFSILDFVTDNKKSVKNCMISAPAGYGTTTLLMTLASRLVKDKAAQVYFHKSSSELREGDVFFALSLSSEKSVFFIDNASDHTQTTRNIIQQARESKKSVLLVLGDRTNEWKQAKPTITGDSFEILPLSNSEIESLVDFLSEHNELNKIEHLSREHQISSIQRNYQRELLVAIREATENSKIEAIIEDEFWGIKDEFAKKVYSIVSCFNQHGALLRVELLAKLLNVSIIEMFDKIKGFLDGVIVNECINEFNGEYALRTRHPLIAAIVWDRCVEPSSKDLYIHQSIDNLNILHKTDKRAFEYFIRSERFIDSLKTLESKIQFFEKACRKDPDNPYVRQHFARMYLRENIDATALTLIDDAIKMNGKIRVLYHTKGYILQKMVEDSDSEEIGKRRLLQSEEAYYTGLKMNPNDEYCFQGLAQLYLAWAKKVNDDEQRTTYISKAEEIINEALKKVRNKEGLWIESSNIDSFIGDSRARIRSLENAVANAPRSIISRYLLAKAYNINGLFEKSMPILSNLVREYPDEYRPSIEYAFTIIKAGGSLESAIAVLNQSTLYGYSDPLFVATLGGMLFLNKEFTKAEKVFDEAVKREFSNARVILFDPEKRLGHTNEYDAVIKYVGDRHSYVLIKGFTEIYCPSSKYHGLILQRDMNVRVTIAFTPKSPVIKKVRALMSKVEVSVAIKN
ncbi:tetratricopeptide (TPR) repeat protein [Paenibacillus forsythiae]|uniref:Tetratricopeptide (TPR) repeat protein n=1 Tax=Paenibacillus forsythiae TaxID=365616 RepID=A0ABU3HEH0_9BACL|nr:SIR2 family protein [Paenibacillus forsythiae]MDT3429204.1 tetratricopeptide (TPR) repeat protein [Paenibacillus forsythiae]